MTFLFVSFETRCSNLTCSPGQIARPQFSKRFNSPPAATQPWASRCEGHPIKTPGTLPWPPRLPAPALTPLAVDPPQGLTKLLSDQAPEAMKEQKFENYFGRKIAVDASMHIYSFLVSTAAARRQRQT